MHLGTPKNQDIREAVEQSAQGGREGGRAVRGEKAEKAATSRVAPKNLRPFPPPLHPHTSKCSFFLTYTTLPDMLKPVVPGDDKGREGGRGHIGDMGEEKEEEEEGRLPGAPGDGREGASRMVEASRLACSSPRRTSSGAGPVAWECGRRSPGSCRALPREAACSSSWPWPCCSRPSRSTFAV